MKRQQVNKLYNKLSPKELANLAFIASQKPDKREMNLIINSVERRNYTAPHVEYHERINGLIQLSGIFGTTYWKLFSLISTCNLSKTGDALDGIAQKHINEFIALNIALNNVCQILNIDNEIIRIYAQCRGIEPDFKGIADDTLIIEYTESFTISAKLA